jgi:endonuclease YncB( thermonuclease family)
MTITGMAALAALLVLPPTAASAQRKPAAKDVSLYIVSPADGDTVKGAFWCRFGLRNMVVSHAGDDFPNSGHHHLLIDVDEPIDLNEPIPQDKKHLHYGAGETEALIELPPGKHTLQLVFSDAWHYNFDPPVVSKKITIRVKDPDAPEERAHTTRNYHTRARAHRRAARMESRKPGAEAVPATPEPSGPIAIIGRALGVSK